MAVVVREAEGMGDISALTDLMVSVWGEAFLDPAICRAIQFAGGYVAGSWEGDRVVAASLAFVGRHDDEVVLHSHATATAPGLVSQGLGLALKWHQRRWALDRGIGAVEWTYDPLVARNGWFNLTKLGARGVRYLVDFYGRRPGAIEQGEETDRALVRWDLEDPKVVAAAAGGLDPLEVGARRAEGAPVLVSVGPDGGPVPGAPAQPGGPALAQVAPDIEGLRRTDSALATAWRQAVRETLGTAMQEGRDLTAADRTGWYLLEPTAA